MKKFSFIYLFILATGVVSAQHDRVYDFTENLIARNPQAHYQDVVNVGEYKEALRLYDKTRPGTPYRYAPGELEQIRLVNAHRFITERTKNYQVFMINEGHHNPHTRAFTLSLLQDLYQQGYRYFGAEAINFTDSLLNERGFPVMGTLTMDEPVYGELLRQALKIGFKVFDYECNMPFYRQYDSLQYHIAEYKSVRTGAMYRAMMDTVNNIHYVLTDIREKEQAENIYRILQKDPSAKIVVHAGYGHLYKNPSLMGGEFLKISQMETFNVDQIFPEEHLPPDNDSLYQYFNITEPVSLCDSLGNAFKPARWGYGIDAHVIHPLTTYTNGRPDWMSLNGTRKPVAVKKYLKGLPLPVIITCYYQNEFDKVGYEAMPADAIQMVPGEELKPLMLQAGNYWLRVRSKGGKVVAQKMVVK